jgi:hypothetical protein
MARQTQKQLLTNCSSVGLQTFLLLGQQMCICGVCVLLDAQPAFCHTDVLVRTTKASCAPLRCFACMSNVDVSSSNTILWHLIVLQTAADILRFCMRATQELAMGHASCKCLLPSCKMPSKELQSDGKSPGSKGTQCTM